MTAGSESALPSVASVDLAEADLGQVSTSQNTPLLYILETYRDPFRATRQESRRVLSANCVYLLMTKGEI